MKDIKKEKNKIKFENFICCMIMILSLFLSKVHRIFPIIFSILPMLRIVNNSEKMNMMEGKYIILNQISCY